ncbi:MAG: cobalt ECF transporter T component CbiQ [Clostridiales Family XIII bacterium]|jgi:cobalt/nickel transport system permease protein|nr:cobalt ECF transporter T component CbiQ [Clostridiales Family XIII bacterium]
MSNIHGSLGELHALDALAAGRTTVHRLHPLAKLCSALIFILAVVSFGRYDFLPLTPYLFYPFILMALAEIPYGILLKRVLVALPFCLFAGLSNVFFDRETAFTLGSVTISYGVLSLLTILLKMYLSVMAALLLVATTPFVELTAQLRRLRVPMQFVTVFEMTYRYAGVLLLETRSMGMAYALRSGGKRALEMRHMGSFVGGLLLRGFDRAERIHAAMRCRGYSLRTVPRAPRPLRGADVWALAAIVTASAVLRFVRLF